jgi:hypothetical protein
MRAAVYPTCVTRGVPQTRHDRAPLTLHTGLFISDNMQKTVCEKALSSKSGTWGWVCRQHGGMRCMRVLHGSAP